MSEPIEETPDLTGRAIRLLTRGDYRGGFDSQADAYVTGYRDGWQQAMDLALDIIRRYATTTDKEES